jgi:hypothetical protein
MQHDLVGVSVFANGGNLYLRFHLRPQHLQKIGDPKKLLIRGNPGNGFILAPATNSDGRSLAKAGKNLLYLQQAASGFEMSARTRRPAWLRPGFENGHIRIPGMPPAWINVTPEFDPDQEPAAFEEGNRTAKLPRNGRDNPITTAAEVKPVGNGTSPLPKGGNIEGYRISEGADIVALQSDLAARLDDARAIIKAIEERSGLKLMLDRNLRLVVALPAR